MPIWHEGCATAKPSTLEKPQIAFWWLNMQYCFELSTPREWKQTLSIHTTLNRKSIWCLFLWHRPVLEASEENMCRHISSHSSLVHSSSFQQLAAYRLICSRAPASDRLLWNLEIVEECMAFVCSRSGNGSPKGWGQQENCQWLNSLSSFVFPSSLG